jgi:hypothetical protein
MDKSLFFGIDGSALFNKSWMLYPPFMESQDPQKLGNPIKQFSTSQIIDL